MARCVGPEYYEKVGLDSEDPRRGSHTCAGSCMSRGAGGLYYELASALRGTVATFAFNQFSSLDGWPYKNKTTQLYTEACLLGLNLDL